MGSIFKLMIKKYFGLESVLPYYVSFKINKISLLSKYNIIY